MVDKLAGANRRAALRELHGWTEVADRDAIRKVYHFADFSQAWGFLSRVALVAEKMGHYPEWLNITNRVEILLTTTDVDGLSQRDIDMAVRIDQFAPRHDTADTP